MDSIINGLKTALKGKQKLVAINKKALTIGYELV